MRVIGLVNGNVYSENRMKPFMAAVLHVRDTLCSLVAVESCEMLETGVNIVLLRAEGCNPAGRSASASHTA